MSKELMIAVLNHAENGNEILQILDSFVDEVSQESEDTSDLNSFN
jgi:hypothetical protein